MRNQRRSVLRDLSVFWRYGMLHQHRPFVASFKLTHDCNLTCKQCPFVHQPQPSLSFQAVIEVLDQLYARGNRIVILEGGEPLLWRDGNHSIADVLRAARQRFDCVGVTTNGTLPLTIEPDIVWVSIDGFRETNARLRGADIFDHVLDNIRKSSHPRIYAHITANRENASEMPDLIRYLNEIVRGITVQFYYPYAKQDDLFLPLIDRARLIDQLIELKRERVRLLNSIDALTVMKQNTWRCESWLFDNANADGTFRQGCYLLGRAGIDCSVCGFTPFTEASLAYHGHWRSIQAGLRIFF